MTVCASLVVLSEPITFHIQMLITHSTIVISLSDTHTCVEPKKDYNFGVKKFYKPETPINIILTIHFIML